MRVKHTFAYIGVAMSAMVFAAPGHDSPQDALPTCIVLPPGALAAAPRPGTASDSAAGLTLALVGEGAESLGWQRGRLIAAGGALCLTAAPADGTGADLQLQACNGVDATQHWQWKQKWVQADDGIALLVFQHETTAKVLERGGPGAAQPVLALRSFARNNGNQQFPAQGCGHG